MYSTMTLKALLLAFLTALSGCACAATPAIERAAVVQVTANGGHQCTAVALGKHTVLTNFHCLDYPAGVLKFNGEGCKGDRVLARDGTDNVLIQTCATFSATAKLSSKTPTEGEKAILWGYPLGIGLFYREATFAGKWIDTLSDYAGKRVWMWDVSSAPGDSGAPLFDKAGRVLCTMSFSVAERESAPHFHLMACFPPRFTSEQLRKIL